MPVRRAALYVRVSSQGQVRDGYSLTFQEQILREFCQREGLAVADIYRDGGRSGSTTHRKDLLRLIEEARQDRFDMVLIFRVDRFSRDPVDLLALVRELESRQIKLRSVTEAVDASDPAGELMLTILGAIGKFVRQNIIQNAMLGKVKRAETGRFTGGRVPFGYVVGERGQYDPDGRPWWNGSTAAEVARMVYTLYLGVACQGAGCGTLARQLNSMGIPGPRGRWGHSTVHQLLTNPCYAGDFAYNKVSHQLNKRSQRHKPEEWVIVPDSHEPLVDRQTWEQVQQVLKVNRLPGSGRPPNDDFKDLLTGFLRCGACGAALTPRHKSKHQQQQYYTCLSRYSERRRRDGTACLSFPYIRFDELESLVWSALVQTAADPGRVEELWCRMRASSGPEVPEAEMAVARLAKRLEALEQQEMTLTTAFSEGKLPEHLWQKQLHRLEIERGSCADGLTDARARLAELKAQSDLAASTEEIQGYLVDILSNRTSHRERREALSILVGPRGIRVFPDGTVDFAIKIPTAAPARLSTANLAGPTRPAPSPGTR